MGRECIKDMKSLVLHCQDTYCAGWLSPFQLTGWLVRVSHTVLISQWRNLQIDITRPLPLPSIARLIPSEVTVNTAIAASEQGKSRKTRPAFGRWEELPRNKVCRDEFDEISLYILIHLLHMECLWAFEVTNGNLHFNSSKAWQGKTRCLEFDLAFRTSMTQRKGSRQGFPMDFQPFQDLSWWDARLLDC